MNLELMRLSMWPRADIGAEEAIGPDGKPVPRESWLRDVFSRQIVFDYRGHEFHFVPAQDEIEEPFLAGRIGLLGRVRENEPPEAGLADTMRDRWKAIAVLIDPRAHGDGQKAAVEFGTGVAKPYPIFSALVKHVNRGPPQPIYVLDVKPIADSSDFWSFVDRNEGEVTSVSFEFLAPNMFGIESDMDKEANDLKRYEKARKAEITIESEAGLNLRTDRVRKTVEYTSRGGGEIRARSRRERFSSGRKSRRITVPDEPTPDPAAEDVSHLSLRAAWSRIIDYLFKQ